MSQARFQDLKIGDVFQFLLDGDVYVRSRGGYRPGRGGPLVRFRFPSMPVIRYGV